jgi:hypothetical protein
MSGVEQHEPGGDLMKQYAIRNTGRTPVQCECSCFADSAVINGSVWDLSATGWRATMDRPVPIGLEKSVFMTLRDGNGCLPIFIDSAIVRWSEGRQTGWEITHIDDSAHTRLTEFMAQHERAESTADVRAQTPRSSHRHMHPTRSA